VAPRARSHPFACEARRTAKVFAEAEGISAAQGAIRVAQELRLDVDGLDRSLVEIVDVGLLGQRGRKLLLRRGCHAVYLALGEAPL
jgi:hypothetical protein